MRRPFGRKWDGERGRLVWQAVDSRALAGNLFGDPARRELAIWLPPGHESGRGLPLLVDLAAYGKSALAHLAWKGEDENLPERLDRLVGSGAMPPAAVLFPDCYTRLGGTQYVDSPATGAMARFLIEEAVPAAEARTGAGGPGRRGLFGHSSGGYGALYHMLVHGDFWSAGVSHAGDMAFDLAYLPDWPGRMTTLAAHGDIPAFIRHFEDTARPGWPERHLMMLLCMAASYDPDPRAPLGIRLPLDPRTAELDEARWARWQAFDPVHLARAADLAGTALDPGAGDGGAGSPQSEGGESDEPESQGLDGGAALWIDCGTRDEYHLHYGARRLSRILTRRGVAHHYEEFEDGHGGLDYRLDRSLPWLAARLSA